MVGFVAWRTLAGSSTGSLQVPPPTGGGASAATVCSALDSRLPAVLDGARRRRTDPMSPRTAAWGNPPVVLRCGVPAPPELLTGPAGPVSVDGVTWLQDVGRHAVRWTVIDRPVYLQLTVPTSYPSQGGFLVELAPAVATLPYRPTGP